MELIELSMENRVFKIHRTLVEKIRKLFHVKNDILLDTIDEMLTDEKLYYDFLETEFINVLTNFCEIVDIDMELLDASEYECKQVLQSLKKDDSFQKIIFHLKNLYDKLFKIRHKYGSESNYAYTFSKRLVNDKVNTINFINVALEFWDIENLLISRYMCGPG